MVKRKKNIVLHDLMYRPVLILSTTLFLSLLFFFSCDKKQETEKNWHNQTRELRYRPGNGDFVITNGTHRFNRALYGSNTGFRVEAGDLPEFAMYMPRMGGNLKFGLIQADSSKWLIDASQIEARYRAGTMIYQISDSILKDSKINIQVLALADTDGMIIKIFADNVPQNIELFWAFGGATGKRFSRDGDLGADPESSFYLKPEYCTDNKIISNKNTFTLYYGSGRSRSDNEVYENNYKPGAEELESTHLKNKKRIWGYVPKSSTIKNADASKQDNPNTFYSSSSEIPAAAGKLKLQNNDEFYFLLLDPDSKNPGENINPAELFLEAEMAREKIAGRIKIDTPDEYINAVGSNLATAANAVWDGQSYMHGAIAWRMPLNGWRGAYAADWLGWHDRAKTHFLGYFDAQYTEPESGPSVPDPATHLARQKEETGTALFSEGYISRNPGKLNKPHHYDMNLVFISQLLSHFNWTGDLEFLKKSWPVLKRHLAWEKRNFDANDDGLYDAYCCIWASDALQYSGGGVTHSSAYNYRANKMAAELAVLIGENPDPFQAEAEKIKKALNQQLWMAKKGWFAEYKDLLGNQLLHTSAALWTIYHSIDEGLADPFQAYQMTQYIDKNIPHIPVWAKGLPAGNYYTLATTNWMPYTWSINNVALAEVLHTALAYWQSGRNEEAFNLSKSSFLDYMFMGTSPGNFGQLSFYDAFRGELYRDFADPVGIASRVFVEGLFGINPDLLHQTIQVRPGWPESWNHASLETPDLKLKFKKEGNKEFFSFASKFEKPVKLTLIRKAKFEQLKTVRVNGQEADWKQLGNAIGVPEITIETTEGTNFEIELEWSGKQIEKLDIQDFYALGNKLSVQLKNAKLLSVYDPQGIFENVEKGKQLTAVLAGETGWRTAFLQLKQGNMSWWQPVSFELKNAISFVYSKNQADSLIRFSIQNNSMAEIAGNLFVGNFSKKLKIPARSVSEEIQVSAANLLPGSNTVLFKSRTSEFSENIINWQIQSNSDAKYETVAINDFLNDRVTNIFSEQYYSPRSPYPTLSIPVQGIGDWCSFRETEEIEDSGYWEKSATTGQILSPQGIPFATPTETGKNIIFTSKWNNYPDSVRIPVSGKASHLYLLMAGSVHHMQIHMVNGIVRVDYQDGTSDTLELKSPDNWWPIEQDYYEDGYAFKLAKPQPPRLYLKTGEWHLESYPVLAKNKTIKIEGGAASLLDLPLNPEKELKSLSIEARTNDLVIGLMAATLKR